MPAIVPSLVTLLGPRCCRPPSAVHRRVTATVGDGRPQGLSTAFTSAACGPRTGVSWASGRKPPVGVVSDICADARLAISGRKWAGFVARRQWRLLSRACDADTASERRDTVVATQTLVQSPTRRLVESTESIDWETSAGPADVSVRARLERGPFTYQGGGEPHWRGQCCHEDPQVDAQRDRRAVIMSCGCRASVPWWVLEPLRA